jgi:hypothetical protein
MKFKHLLLQLSVTELLNLHRLEVRGLAKKRAKLNQRKRLQL